jgi:hypothetical protein
VKPDVSVASSQTPFCLDSGPTSPSSASSLFEKLGSLSPTLLCHRPLVAPLPFVVYCRLLGSLIPTLDGANCLGASSMTIRVFSLPSASS